MAEKPFKIPRHWWGKIVGGLIGLFRGGITGALIGALLGHFVDRFIAGFVSVGATQRAFFDGLFASLEFTDPLKVRSIELMRSHVSRDGTHHSILSSVRLGTAR